MVELLSGVHWRLAAAVFLALALAAMVAFGFAYRYSEPSVARDFEECVEQVQAEGAASDERTALIAHCQEQFAGRRKAGGGYTYYDFMQNKTFDIAGPNPTDDERRQIDHAYMEFLDAQGRDAVLTDLAKRRAEQEQAALERSLQAAGPPLELTPKVPLPVRRPLNRSKDASCEDGTLSCSWAKLSTAVKNAFASSAKGKPQTSPDY